MPTHGVGGYRLGLEGGPVQEPHGAGQSAGKAPVWCCHVPAPTRGPRGLGALNCLTCLPP